MCHICAVMIVLCCRWWLWWWRWRTRATTFFIIAHVYRTVIVMWVRVWHPSKHRREKRNPSTSRTRYHYTGTNIWIYTFVLYLTRRLESGRGRDEANCLVFYDVFIWCMPSILDIQRVRGARPDLIIGDAYRKNVQTQLKVKTYLCYVMPIVLRVIFLVACARCAECEHSQVLRRLHRLCRRGDAPQVARCQPNHRVLFRSSGDDDTRRGRHVQAHVFAISARGPL